MDILENSLLYKIACRPKYMYRLLEKLPIQIFPQSEDNKIRFDTFGHQSKAYTMDLSTLTYYNFRENSRGSLIDLITSYSNKPKDEVISDITLSLYTCDEVPIEIDVENKLFKPKFSLEFPEIYESNSLDNIPKIISKLFLDDGLWSTTQEKWGIRYASDWNRIVIPVYQDDYLVGAIGRLNKYSLADNECKYLPYLSYKKSRVLFGYDENLEALKTYKKVILVESEKSVMKADQFKFKYPVLAVGGSSISRHHIERLNMLGIEEVVWCQDKGVEDNTVLRNNVQKLMKYSKAEKVGYIDVDSCKLLEDKECVYDLENRKQCKFIIKHFYKEAVRGRKKEENIQ